MKDPRPIKMLLLCDRGDEPRRYERKADGTIACWCEDEMPESNYDEASSFTGWGVLEGIIGTLEKADLDEEQDGVAAGSGWDLSPGDEWWDTTVRRATLADLLEVFVELAPPAGTRITGWAGRVGTNPARWDFDSSAGCDDYQPATLILNGGAAAEEVGE